MSILTLPGTIAGLLRPCSPVIVTRGTYAGLRGVVVSIADGIAMVAIDRPSISSLIALGLDDLALDLADATGRAHAAWWVSSKHAAFWLWPCEDGRGWQPSETVEVPNAHALRETYPGLVGDLNSDDPRLLPDGSRWVDAEALRLVCLHVAGLPS